MIDFENDLVVAYLTNAINTPVYEPTSMANANQFSGRYYTASTLGFVPQLLYMGLGAGGRDPQEAIENVLQDMVREKQKLVDQAAEAAGGELPEDHPIRRALQALEEAAQ